MVLFHIQFHVQCKSYHELKKLCFIFPMILIFTSLPSMAEDQGVSLGGYIKGFVFQQMASPWDFDRAGTRLQLTASGGDGDPASYYGSVDFELDSRLLQTDMGLRRGKGFDVWPVELYLNLSFESFDVIIGQQFVFWGTTTWINPTDVLTGWDFANMASEIEDYRLAPVAARLNWYITDDLKLDLVWIPIFRPNRLPGMPPPSLGEVPIIETTESLPEQNFKNGQLGIRLSHSVSSWAFDWAVCAYRGFEKFPTIMLSPVFSQGEQGPVLQGMKWNSSYSKMWMVGGDFAKALGSAMVRGEIAYKASEDMAGTNPVVENPRLEYVLGLSYSFSEDLEIGLQYIGKYLANYDRGTELAALEKMGYPDLFAQKQLDHQGSLFCKLKITDDLGTQLLGIYDISYSDFFILGFFWWQLADGVKAYLGAVAFGGIDDSTPFARQSSSSQAFMEIKVSY